MRLSKLYKGFFESEKAGGLLIVFFTLLSLLLSNLPMHEAYITFWETKLGGHSLENWSNDALMSIFFLLIGLELEREMYKGELSNLRNAALPFFGALGGMLVPALLYSIIAFGSGFEKGFGITMATDIAFALAILSLLGKRVPASLKIFLTALAVIDDLGAILVIALFYSGSLAYSNLMISLAILGSLFVFNRLKVHNPIPYIIGGIAMWYFMWHSGIHPTISGVLLAFVIPFGDGGETSLSYKLQHWLHKPVAFVILPIFAMANTCIHIEGDFASSLITISSIGVFVGLVLGKPLGIFLFSYLSVKLKWSSLPNDITWKHLTSAGILGGIGFTMSIFITLLAFNNEQLINSTKLTVLLSSTCSALLGYFLLKKTLPTKAIEEEEIESESIIKNA